jgi:cytochrome c5
MIKAKLLLIRNILIINGIFMLFSCTHDPVSLDSLDPVCFDTQVLPIMQTSCGMTGCHDGTSEGFNASGYEAIMQAVKPGDPRNSTLYKVITDVNGENMMPPDRPLTLEQRSIIQVWIAQGAEEILCSDNSGGGGTNRSDSVCFVQNILPLFISNCSMASCHDGLSQGEEDLFPLNSYATIREHVVPFNPAASSVYRAVNGLSEEFMPPPPKSPLTAAQKELMRKWIADGALNSDCPDANCDTSGTISFAAQVKSIVDNYCVSCHNSTVTSGGVNLNGYTQVKSYAESIRSGIPVLLGTIRHDNGFKAMPPSTKLDECSIRKIELWIEQGILNN